MLFNIFKNKNYNIISQKEAKEIIDNNDYNCILDVREEFEYNEGHIKGAILLPLGELEKNIFNVVKEKDSKILIYCRSGNRSKQAANKLAKMGYKNIYEFGGIITWKYGIEK